MHCMLQIFVVKTIQNKDPESTGYKSGYDCCFLPVAVTFWEFNRQFNQLLIKQRMQILNILNACLPSLRQKIILNRL